VTEKQNPLGSLLKELTPDSTSGDSLKATVQGAAWSGMPEEETVSGWSNPSAPPKRIAHAPPPPPPRPRSPSPIKETQESPGDNETADSHEEENGDSDDELGDLPVPVFA